MAEQQSLKNGKMSPDAVREMLSSRPDDQTGVSLAGEEAISFLAKLAIAQRKSRAKQEKAEEKGDQKDISPSPSLQLKASEDKIKEIGSSLSEHSQTSKESPKSDDLAELTRKLAKSVSAAISEISPAKLAYTPTTRSQPATPTRKPKYTMEKMAKESAREEELRKQWPDYLPWPSLDDCQQNPPSRYIVFTSTWLSVTAKKIK